MRRVYGDRDTYLKKCADEKQARIDAYNASPTLCKSCNLSIDYEKNKTKNKFCSHTCAASFNNKNREVNYVINLTEPITCALCQTVFFVDKRYTTTKYCKQPSCTPVYKPKLSSKPNVHKYSKVCHPKLIRDPNLYSKTCYAIRKLLGNFLEKDSNFITYSDVDNFKELMNSHIHNDNLSPSEINEKYNFKYKNFTLFLTVSLGLKIKTCKEATKNYNDKIGKSVTNEKILYWRDCQFKFSPYQEPRIENFDLLKKYKMFRDTSSCFETTLQRDHMLSITYGWDNNIPAGTISHPANCKMLFTIDNIRKGTSCSISLTDLENRIKNWSLGEILFSNISGPRMSEQRRIKLSQTIKHQRFHTNGQKNIKIHKDLSSPTGFWSGRTNFRKKK